MMAEFRPMLKTCSAFHQYPSAFSIIFFLLFSFALQPKEGLSDDVLKYTNQFRKSRGLTALVMRDDLNAIARRHSEDMANGRCGFGHDGYSQRVLSVAKIIKPFYSMAENVAYGARSGKEVVSLWKNSSGHRKNMLGNYKYIGIGTVRNRRGIIYYTEVFVR
jgi:uncharacterized protein YkwD